VGEHVLGLGELAGVGQRLAVFGKHVEILRGLDGGGLDDRDRLAVAGERAQSARVFDGRRLLARILLVALAGLVRVAPEPRLVRRHGSWARNGAGDVAEVAAAGERRGDRRDRDDESGAQKGGAGRQARHLGTRADGTG